MVNKSIDSNASYRRASHAHWPQGISKVEGVQKPSPKVLKLVIAAGAPFV
jgi:hypothetical protein